MKKKILLNMIVLFAMLQTNIKAQTVYGTLTSGNWNSGTQWETYSTLPIAVAASAGGGTASASTTNPSGTHFAFVRTGHTLSTNLANRGCKSLYIQTGGKLWANEATARRIQIGAGGTGFLYPLVDTVNIDGIFGGANDGIFLETGAAAQLVKIYGTGTIDMQRLRTPGGAGAAAGGTQTVNIDMDMNLWQAANYAFSIKYNPTATDNYTVNIATGKTITVKAVDGYFHNSAGAAAGTYTYNINGTVDLSASTQTLTNLTAFSSIAGTTNLNVFGLIKTGAAFNSSPVSPGVDNLTIKTGGTVDASLATVMNFTNNSWVIEGTGTLKRKVLGDGTAVVYPVSTANTTNNNVSINRTDATPTVYSVNVSNVITNAGPNPTKQVNKQWNITCLGAPSTNDVVKLSWTTADQTAGFLPAGTVNVYHWNGTTYDVISATVTGTGTVADPFVATTTAPVTSYSPFIVSNPGILPVTLISFNAINNKSSVKLNWVTTNEINAEKFEIERASDVNAFSKVGTVLANGLLTTNNYSFNDENPLKGLLYYRLKMIDVDGKFAYSNIAKVNFAATKEMLVSPNPITDKIHVEHAAATKNAKIEIYATNGKKLASFIPTALSTQSNLDIQLVAGTYVLVYTNDGIIEKSMIIKK